MIQGRGNDDDKKHERFSKSFWAGFQSQACRICPALRAVPEFSRQCAGASHYHLRRSRCGHEAGGQQRDILEWDECFGSDHGILPRREQAFHGFLRSPDGKFTTFEAPGADTGAYNGTSPAAINDLGVITGSYTDANGFDHGFLRSPDGKFTTFDVPGAGGYGTTPIALNLEGAVVGWYTDSNYLFHSFVRYPDGKFSAFLAPGQCETNGSDGCYGSELSNINFLGLSVGNYMDNTPNLVQHGLIRHADGTFTTFEAPGAGTGPSPRDGVSRLLRRSQSVRRDRRDLHGLEDRVPRLHSHPRRKF